MQTQTNFKADPWVILLVDDEPEVHTITRLALRDCRFLRRPLAFLSAANSNEAKHVLRSNKNVALAFIDVVMETDQAGLDLVTYVRQELGNEAVRLILRTGQPGVMPERTIIQDFDIDDYMAKTSVTADRLYTATISALRAYAHIQMFRQTQHQLEQFRQGLEQVIHASTTLFQSKSVRHMYQDMLLHLGGLLCGQGEVVHRQVHGLLVHRDPDGSFVVLAQTGRFDIPTDQGLPADIELRLDEGFACARNIHEHGVFVGCFHVNPGRTYMVYLENVPESDEVTKHLLKLFSRSVVVAMEKFCMEKDVRDTQAEMMMALGGLLERRGLETANHVRRVAHISHLLGRAFGLSEEDAHTLFMVSSIHDIGKLAMPDAAIVQPGMSSHDRQPNNDLGLRHALVGAEVFASSDSPVFKAASVVAGQHHEKYDGSGYPQGLSGEHIHLFARIVSLADAFDRLYQDHANQPLTAVDRVMSHLRAQRGMEFDPFLTDLLCQHLTEAIDVLRQFPDPGTEERSAIPAGNVSWLQ